MRILFLTSQFPYPPHSGGALRAYGLIKGAVEAGHQVHLLCFANRPPAPSPLHNWCASITAIPNPTRHRQDRLRDLLLTHHADMERRFWSEAAVEALQRVLAEQRFNIIHAESIEMATYLPVIQAWYPDLPLIYGSLNAEADLQRTMFATDRASLRRAVGALYSWLQWRRLTRFERRVCEASAHVLAVSEPDRVLLQRLSKTPVTVVANGIYTADYLSLPRTTELGEHAMVFTGTMDYRPNVDAVLWFAQEILPATVRQIPTAHLYVVGQRPHPRLEGLRANPQATVTGAVPEVAPYLQGAQVYLAPLRMGSGTRFKLLEAMAAGCAVVSTTIGAQGLGATPGREMVIADSPVDFAAAVAALLSDPARRQALGDAARVFVRDHFDWSVIVPHLLEVYRQLG